MTRGQKICAFIEHYCLIPEGAQVGQPIKLMKFQRKFILDVFDNPHGTSRAYLSVARKNGKSALSKFRSKQDMKDFAKQAERLQAKANSFRWLFLNQRIEAQSPFLSRAEWEACCSPAPVEAGDVCFAGLDLSASRDLTALVLVFPKDYQLHVVPHFWLPEDGLRDKAQSKKVLWDIWATNVILPT